MERIELTKPCKRILRAIKDKKYSNIPENDTEDLLLLEHMGLVDVQWCEFGYAIIANLSNKGVAYMRVNPKLKNPSILDDKKFWINTAISFAALVVAIIALFEETFKDLLCSWIN